MKANVQYNDFTGTVAADISDFIGPSSVDKIKSITNYFKIDLDRFKPIGITIYGTEKFYISILCIDKVKSTDKKEYIVNMSIDIENKKDIIDILFKRLHIVLYDRFETKYDKIDYDEEVNYNEFHRPME